MKLRRGRLTADGRGVKAWAWVDGLQVCSVDGNDDSTALWCDSHTVTIDG